MKKPAIVLAIGLLVLGLTQCNLLTKTIKYEVTSGDSNSFHIFYTSDVSDLTEVSANTSWTYQWTKLNTQDTNLAFIQVTKSTGTDFTVQIYVNDVTEAGPTTGTAGSTVTLYYIIE
jgi:hypothetical protein